MIKAVVFDLDGVLVDAVEWHYSALNQALSLFGFQIAREEHERDYNGLPTHIKLKKLSDKYQLPTSLHCFINEMKQKYTLEILSKNCKPSAKLTSLLNELSAKGYTLALCSNSNRNTVETVLSLMQVRHYFDIVLSANDVRNPKPNPEVYETAFSLMGVTPEDCLIIEDSKPGIQAAKESDGHVLEITGPHELTMDRVEKAIAKIDGFNRRTKSASFAPKPPLEIIIPMAGLGTRFSQAGYKEPKPLIPVFDKPMIQWVVENVRPKNFRSHFTFICNQEHLKTLNVERLLRDIEPTCSIVSVQGVTAGAACTVLLANDRMRSSRPVIIANSDQWVEFNIDEFLEDAFNKRSDGSILTFKASDKKWSYARLAPSTDLVTEVAEKNPISPHATVGIYYFKHAYEMARGLEDMIRKGIRTNGEFYLCPVYNELILRKKSVRIFEIPPEAMHGLGTPEDLTAFVEKNS